MTDDRERWRELSENEVALLQVLTSLDDAGARQLRDQIPCAEARRGCECGCGTIELRVARQAIPPAPVTRSRPVPGVADVLSADPPGGLILFVADGYLDSLEVYSFDEPLPLPTPSDIRPFVRGAS